MIILNDYKFVAVNCNGQKRYNKLYRHACDNCGILKNSYKAKNYSAKLCNHCARNKRNPALHPLAIQMSSVDQDNWKIGSGGIRRYRCRCVRCNKDRKYKRPNEFHKLCQSCSNRGPYYSKIKKVLYNRMSRRMRSALYRRNMNKNYKHIFDIIGYSVEDLKKYLESRFKGAMSWDNIGKWHIDHIKPDCLFNYSSMNDQEFIDC